jgi:2-polyprenyl-3-methyl-5-hydroxy-6-metoxy-1,4-benzoquinol methylase
MNQQDQASSQYVDYGYSSPEPSSGNTSRELADVFVKIVQELHEVTNICDLGCGTGYLAAKLGGRGYRVIGIDASQSGIALAKKNYAGERVSFICAELGVDSPRVLPNEKFDVVVSSDVIEHLYRPSVLLETALLLLKPSGHLIVGTPYHGYLKNLAICLFNKWDSHHSVEWDGGHIKFFSEATLRAMVFRHGFRDIQFRFYGRSRWFWKNMVCHARAPQ